MGVIADLTYGQKVYNGWENVVEPNGYKLSNNEYQISPLAEKIEDNIFLGFGEAFGDIVLHYQLLDSNNLQMLGDDNGTPVFDSGTPQNNYDISATNDGEIFFVFSDQRNFIDNDIYILGALNFSLKTIAKKMHNYDMIDNGNLKRKLVWIN